MTGDLYELILIDGEGRVQARALRVASRKYVEAIANRWNQEKIQDNIDYRWAISKIEGGIAR